MNKFEPYVREIPDFPKKGILFRDITPLLASSIGFSDAVYEIRDIMSNNRITKVVGIESRGFILGAALAFSMRAGFVPIRKKGKLPYKTNSVSYSLEYGTDTLEMHQDAINQNDRVLIIDDLIATGGTAKAAMELVEQAGGHIIGFAFLVELTDLHGVEKLGGYPVLSLVKY